MSKIIPFHRPEPTFAFYPASTHLVIDTEGHEWTVTGSVGDDVVTIVLERVEDTEKRRLALVRTYPGRAAINWTTMEED